MDQTAGKICGQCKEWKALDEFHRDRSKRDGRSSECAECGRKRRRIYYAQKRGEIWERFYEKKSRLGVPLITPAIAQKFWALIQKMEDDSCWEWQGEKNRKGYGLFYIGNGYRTSAHRLSYELTTGEQIGDLFACHKCDNPPCCNPAHIFVGTQKDNIRDRDNKGRANYAHGERCRHAKLNEEEVREIRKISGTITQREIAKRFGIDRAHVSQIVSRKRWAHLD